MKHSAAEILVGLALLLVVTAYSGEGAGCPEPEPVDGGRFEFDAGATPGADGLYPTYSLATVVCYRGFQRQGGVSYIYCMDDGQWSEPPICRMKASDCAAPQAPWNGNVKLRNGLKVGSHAIFKCNRGFRRDGPRRKTCSMTQRGVKWMPAAKITQCVANSSCTNPGVLHNANWTLASSGRRSSHGDESFSPNTKINVTCWPGFASADAPAQITCGMSGEWSQAIPSCQEVICPSLLDIEANISHLHSNMENRTYRLGEVVDYRCDQGYRILGKTWRECSGPNSDFPNRTWSQLDPVCSEILCPDPGSIQYGGRYLVSRQIGGNVTFRCRSGYNLQGSAVRHCLPNGKWSGTLTTCDHESFYCPNPGIPIGGRMVNADEVRYRKGETVMYECHGNKVLVGSAERECTKSRSWTGEAPTCQGTYDFDDPMEVASRMGYKAEGLAIDIRPPPINNNTTASKGRSIDLGYTGGMDIYFAFDASGSIPTNHFKQGLELAKALVRKIGVSDGPRRARYGACVYASKAEIVFLVSNPQPSVGVVNILIDGIAEQHKSDDIGKGTATGKALQLIHTDMIPASDREDAKRILFLFTDGKTNMGGNLALPKREAEILRDEYKVQIHCIGVGQDIDRDELQQIASRPLSEHLFLIETFGEVSLLAQAITKQKLDFSQCGFNGASKIATEQLKGRISGGEDAQDGQWPWQVAMFCDKGIANCEDCLPDFFCGGSLIARNWVLSAAHCFRSCSWSNIRVYTGILDKSDDALQEFDTAQVYSLAREDALIRHENYNGGNLDNDIALLRLNRNATLTPRIRPICMPQQDMEDNTVYSTRGEQPFVVGWGATVPYEADTDNNCRDRQNRGTSQVLQELVIPLQTHESCRSSFAKHFPCSIITDYKPEIAFCAGYTEGNLDACKGDSGGPVMRKLNVADGTTRWVQIGIVSWGEGCAQDGQYGVYTRLSTYKDWIKDHIGEMAFAIR